MRRFFALFALRVWLRGALLCILTPCLASGLTFTLDDLALVPPMSNVNRIALTLSTDVIGTDSDTSEVTGSFQAELDFQFVNETIVPTGITFMGGRVNVSDVQFSYVFGAVQIQTSGIAGSVSTLNPPGAINGTMFDAADHEVLLDQGTVTAPGASFDFSNSPVLASGVGSGEFVAMLTPTPVEFEYLLDVTLTLPIEVEEPFLIPDAPIVGDVNATLTGVGNIVASQQATIYLRAGDYNQDRSLDCQDISLLQQAIQAQSSDLTFDADGNGLVDSADNLAWVTSLKGTLPADANLDFSVDGNDFLAWNSFKFQDGTGWCQGDFDGDGITDGSDFVIWNTFKFSSTNTNVAVPEPTLGWAAFCFLLLVAGRFDADTRLT